MHKKIIVPKAIDELIEKISSNAIYEDFFSVPDYFDKINKPAMNYRSSIVTAPDRGLIRDLSRA